MPTVLFKAILDIGLSDVGVCKSKKNLPTARGSYNSRGVAFLILFVTLRLCLRERKFHCTI